MEILLRTWWEGQDKPTWARNIENEVRKRRTVCDEKKCETYGGLKYESIS